MMTWVKCYHCGQHVMEYLAKEMEFTEFTLEHGMCHFTAPVCNQCDYREWANEGEQDES